MSIPNTNTESSPSRGGVAQLSLGLSAAAVAHSHPETAKTVKRADLYQAIYQQIGLSRIQSATPVELVLKEITNCLERGGFVVRRKAQRMGRNPKTGEEVPISPRRVIVFQ
jgi:integration host factor subunit alpha